MKFSGQSNRDGSAALSDDEILSAVSGILTTSYNYSVSGDLYMQVMWRRLRSRMEAQATEHRLAAPGPESRVRTAHAERRKVLGSTETESRVRKADYTSAQPASTPGFATRAPDFALRDASARAESIVAKREPKRRATFEKTMPKTHEITAVAPRLTADTGAKPKRNAKTETAPRAAARADGAAASSPERAAPSERGAATLTKAKRASGSRLFVRPPSGPGPDSPHRKPGRFHIRQKFVFCPGRPMTSIGKSSWSEYAATSIIICSPTRLEVMESSTRPQMRPKIRYSPSWPRTTTIPLWIGSIRPSAAPSSLSASPFLRSIP